MVTRRPPARNSGRRSSVFEAKEDQRSTERSQGAGAAKETGSRDSSKPSYGNRRVRSDFAPDSRESREKRYGRRDRGAAVGAARGATVESTRDGERGAARGTARSAERTGGETRAGGGRTGGFRGARGGSVTRSFTGRERPASRRGQPVVEPLVDAVEDEFITGRRAVVEALKSERAINKLLVQENASGGGLGELLALAREHGVVVQQVPKAKLDDVAKNRSHQGVLAYVAAKPYLELEDLIVKAKSGFPGLLVVLDGVEDPHNLGSILRSVDGVGAAGVIIPKRRAVPLTGTVSKASAGALEHVDVARVSNVVQALQRLKKEGFWITGAASEAKQLYTEVDFTGNVVLVIGNEGEGIARLTAQTCDALVKLPMQGQVNSLNAGVAAGILLYEVVRQRAAKK